MKGGGGGGGGGGGAAVSSWGRCAGGWLSTAVLKLKVTKVLGGGEEVPWVKAEHLTRLKPVAPNA